MKTLRLIHCVLASFLVASAVVPAQDFCGMKTASLPASSQSIAPQPQSIAPHGGAHLPAKGDIRGLVIFVQTQNDRQQDGEWPLDSLPTWAGEYTSELRNYFLAMSNGALRLNLDIYPSLFITPGSEWDFLGSSRNGGDAIKDFLTAIDDEVDFTVYDLWNSEGRAYSVRPGGDRRVDLIVTIYRRTETRTFMPYSGVSDLAFNGFIFVDSGKVYIYGGEYATDAGASGISLVQSPGSGMVTTKQYAFGVSIHEIMHKIIGEGHPIDIYGSMGIMASGGNGIAMNSFERHSLGYMNFKELTPGVDTVLFLRDYLTYDEAVLVPIPQRPRWYYVIEFHALKNAYDSAPAKGIYFLRVYDSPSYTQKDITVVHAGGNHQWALDPTTMRPHPVSPDPLRGQSVYQRLMIDGKPFWADGWWGDPHAAFNLQRREFSVLRNPTTDFYWAGETVHTNLYFTVTDMTDSTAVLFVSYTPPPILAVDTPAGTPIVLGRNYPNPVSALGQTVLPFTLEAPGHVRISVVDVLGREMATIVQGYMTAGQHSAVYAPGNIPSGLYRFILQTDTFSASQAFHVVR